MNNAQGRENEYLRKELAQVKEVLGTLIAWIGYSANSPISQKEVEILLRKLSNE